MYMYIKWYNIYNIYRYNIYINEINRKDFFKALMSSFPWNSPDLKTDLKTTKRLNWSRVARE